MLLNDCVIAVVGGGDSGEGKGAASCRCVGMQGPMTITYITQNFSWISITGKLFAETRARSRFSVDFRTARLKRRKATWDNLFKPKTSSATRENGGRGVIVCRVALDRLTVGAAATGSGVPGMQQRLHMLRLQQRLHRARPCVLERPPLHCSRASAIRCPCETPQKCPRVRPYDSKVSSDATTLLIPPRRCRATFH